jgi:uncharacterized protein with GYD domain
MPHYLIQGSYAPEAWAALLKNPHDRSEVVRAAVEPLGGRLEQCWLSFGENDIVIIVQMPDNVSAAAIAIAVAATGALKSLKTTPLMSIQEGMEAMRKAAGTNYRPATAGA